MIWKEVCFRASIDRRPPVAAEHFVHLLSRTKTAIHALSTRTENPVHMPRESFSLDSEEWKTYLRTHLYPWLHDERPRYWTAEVVDLMLTIQIH